MIPAELMLTQTWGKDTDSRRGRTLPQTHHFGAVRGRSPSAPTPSWPWLTYPRAPSLHRGRRSRPGCAAAAPCSSPTSGEALDLRWGSVSLPVSGTISCRTRRVDLAPILSPCPAWACRLAPALSTRLAEMPQDRDSDAGPPAADQHLASRCCSPRWCFVSRKWKWKDHSEEENHQAKTSHVERRRMVHVSVCSPA